MGKKEGKGNGNKVPILSKKQNNGKKGNGGKVHISKYASKIKNLAEISKREQLGEEPRVFNGKTWHCIPIFLRKKAEEKGKFQILVLEYYNNPEFNESKKEELQIRFPGGGLKVKDFDLEACAKREADEETHLLIRKFGKSIELEKTRNHSQLIMLVEEYGGHLLVLGSGGRNPIDRENGNPFWVDCSELRKIISGAHMRILEKLTHFLEGISPEYVGIFNSK